MATDTILAPLDVSAVEPRRFAGCGNWSDYWAITKPEVNFLIAITTAVSFYVASPAGVSQVPWAALLHTLAGTVLVASGAATLNQWMEHPFDARMRRTARRPIAAGRIKPVRALIFGMLLSLGGIAYLAVAANILTSLLAAFTLLNYLFLYTPAKRITPLCTLIGAIPGALPPLIGWTAARGRLTADAWVLFAIVFFWQFPHFMAIAWMYREDYARAGYLVLPRHELRDRFVTWQTVLPAIALLAVGLIPATRGVSGPVHFCGSLVLGAIFLYYSTRFAFFRSTVAARRLLAASIIYLPAILALMWLTKK